MGQASGERGATLVIVLVIMMLGGLTVAALTTFAQTNLRAAAGYRARTTNLQSASDAVDLAITKIRYDKKSPPGKDYLYGAEGHAIPSATYGAGQATCIANHDSGTDRTVTCTGTAPGGAKVTTKVRFIDQNGDQPGSDVQVLARTVG